MARDQEIFETPDFPEETFNYDDDQKSAAVEREKLSVQSAYDKFKGKMLDGKDIDFSDSVSRGAQSGFKIQPGEFEGVTHDREEETLMQRFLRLKEEVGQLVSDVESVQESQGDAEKLLQVSPADMLHDVKVLQKQLHGLQLDRVLGVDMLVTPQHPYQAVLMRDLKAQIQALKTRGEGPAEGGDAAESQATYEVYTRTEAAKFAHLSKLGEVERRLSQLEALVGNQESTVSSVTGGLDSKERDLSSAVLTLQSKVALLDADHISTVTAQLQGLLTLVEQVDSKAREQTQDPEKSARVTDALETVGQLASVAPLVPDLVERLHALKELHERASQFAGSVAYIADSQEQLTGETKELKALLAQVQLSLQNNMATLQSEFTQLGSRITSLQNKS